MMHHKWRELGERRLWRWWRQLLRGSGGRLLLGRIHDAKPCHARGRPVGTQGLRRPLSGEDWRRYGHGQCGLQRVGALGGRIVHRGRRRKGRRPLVAATTTATSAVAAATATATTITTTSSSRHRSAQAVGIPPLICQGSKHEKAISACSGRRMRRCCRS